MPKRTISIPDELDARIRRCSRQELPNLSQLITKLLSREITRIESRREHSRD